MSKRIENIILTTLVKQPANYWQLMTTAGTQYGLFISSLKNLLSKKLITHSNALYSLTSQGIQRIEQLSFNTPILTSDAQSQLKEIALNRPERKDELDQALAPLDVILDRLSILEAHGDLHDTRIVMLGDDDCMGAALALTGKPKEVVILEYDQELCDYYTHYQLPGLTIYRHDLCHPIPQPIKGSADVFFTDPCPSLDMLKVFLSRGLETLSGEGCVGYTAMSQTEASVKKWHALQKLLINAHCAITDLKQHVNTYDLEGDWLMHSGWNVLEDAPYPPPQPTSHWYCSALMRIETVQPPLPFIKGSIEWNQALYKDAEVILTEKEKAGLFH